MWTEVAKKQPMEVAINDRSDYFARIDLGPNRAGQLRALCYPCGAESQSGPPVGSPSTGRCVAREKLSRVKLVEDAWRADRIIPVCMAEADIEAEDHPVRDPQKGH